MLVKIALTNFKCFDHLDLSCKPLNLLCGMNGMGKSSVIQALLVLRQSFETGELLRGNLVLGGERSDIGTGYDVLFDDAETDEIGFSLDSSDVQEPWNLSFAYSQRADRLSPIPRHSQTPGEFEYVSSEWHELPPFGGKLIYVNAERVGPRKLYPLSDVLARRGDFGSDSEYAWNYLSRHATELLSENDPRCADAESRRLIDVIDHWLQDVSPGAHLQLEEIDEADALIPSFAFDRTGDVQTRPYRATNVGFGLSYVLPVILALLSPPDTLCIIENPESHLHPRGQTKLAELAARASKAGVQIFVETHSDHFMDGVRIAVRDGLIEPEGGAFHYFERDTHGTVVTSPEVDRDGRLSHWPSGFFDQHEENLARLLAPRY